MPTRPALGIALGLLLPATAQADKPTEADLLTNPIPTTAQWFEPEITDDVPKSAGVYHNPGLLFINFDGGQMMSCGGSNNPVDNCSTIMSDVVEPWSQGAGSRAAVVQMMQSDMEDFAYDVYGERPAPDTEYDMVMVGDWNPPPDQGGFAGVAPTIDCWNNTRGETAFTLDFSSTSLVAKITGQEAAHVWGLEHVDSSGDLLFPTTGGANDPSFEDQCHQIVVLENGISPTDAVCPDMHEINCPGQANHQNSYQDLMMVFGPRVPDTNAPTLTIISPTEGEVFPSGSDIELVIGMEDDVAPQIFDVWVALDDPNQGQKLGGTSTHYPGPQLNVPLNGLPDGDHFLRVDLGDMDGNLTDDTVSFVIGMSDSGPTSASDSDSDSGSTTDSGGTTGASGSASGTGGSTDPSGGSSSASDGSSGSDTDGDSDGNADGETDGGCACTAPAPLDAPVALGGLLLLAVTRRRIPRIPDSESPNPVS